MLKKSSVIFIFILAIIILDPIARRLDPNPALTPEQLRKESLEYEASVFSRLRIKREKKEIYKSDQTSYKINSYGYRGSEFEMPKKKWRLIVYGGSSVFDPLVSVSWPEQLQTELRSRGLDVEIINAGIPGASSAEISTRFFSEALLLQPNAVLFYETWNDIRFFNKEADGLSYLPVFQEQKNYYIYPQNRLDGFLAENSYIYLLARYAGLDFVFPEADKNKVDPRVAFYGDDRAYTDDINESYAKQVRINYDVFLQVANGSNIMPILATQAMLPIEGLQEENRHKIDYSFVKINFSGIVKTARLIENEIREVAKNKKVKLVDAAKDFSGNPTMFYDHVHFNKTGSQQFAVYMADQLEKTIKDSLKSAAH